MMLCLFGFTAYSCAATATESQREKIQDTKREHTAAPKRATRGSISEKKIQQAKKAFDPAAPSKLKQGSAAKATNRIVGVFDPKDSASRRNTPGKIDLRDSPGVNAAGKTHNLADVPSTLGDRSQTQQELHKGPSLGQEAAQKSEIGHKHSQHHGHHKHADRPADACANAGSPEEVEKCKKARKAFGQR